MSTTLRLRTTVQPGHRIEVGAEGQPPRNGRGRLLRTASSVMLARAHRLRRSTTWKVGANCMSSLADSTARSSFSGLSTTRTLRRDASAGESNIAMTHLAMGNPRKALDHSEKAVRLLDRSEPTEVQEEEVLYNHYLVLHDNQRVSEARDFLKRAYAKVMSKAGKIRDSATRDTFLTRVSINRNINAAWMQQASVISSSIA